MSTAESIYELVKTLSEEEAFLVLEFAEFVQQRTRIKEKFLANSDSIKFQAVSLKTKEFKFNRDEANER